MSLVRLALAAPLAFLLAPLAHAQVAPPMLPADATLLQVSAHGESHRVADVATINAGVVTRNANANTAMRDNANRMGAVMAALKQAGVADRDIRTSNINLQPQYNYAENQPPKITGYEMINNVDVRLRDMTKVGDVLDALVKLGANQINGPTFGVDQPDAALDEARRDAMQAASARANLYAQATGLRVRRIISISESQANIGQPVPMMLMRAKTADAATPVATGENTLAVDVSVAYELGK